jgi:hypothetical protein
MATRILVKKETRVFDEACLDMFFLRYQGRSFFEGLFLVGLFKAFFIMDINA